MLLIKMKTKKLDENIELPEGCTVQIEKGIVTLKGPKGELTKNLFHPRLTYDVQGNQVIVFVCIHEGGYIFLIRIMHQHCSRIFSLYPEFRLSHN